MVCNLLIASAEEKYKNLKFHIILTVPACTFELLAKTLDTAKDKINSFHIFALNDNTERNAGWPAPFPGTILYFVSGVCEPIKERTHDLPIVGMQRFYKDEFINNEHTSQKEKNNIRKVMSFLGMKDGKSENVVWSDEACPNINLKNTGDRHGQVIRNADVQRSIFYLLTQ